MSEIRDELAIDILREKIAELEEKIDKLIQQNKIVIGHLESFIAEAEGEISGGT